MITQQFRPQIFSQVAGHELVTKTLKCVVNNPKLAPKSIILQGEFGTGKTTCARILARALNCKHKTADGDACGQCDVCTGDIDKSIYYDEYDSAMVGNVEAIRNLRDTFYFNSDHGYKVIVIDECHLMSKQAQSALLKVIEEMKDNVFFIFCTTDIDDVLNTIRSRSLELRFNLVNETAIKKNLIDIMVKKGMMKYVDCERTITLENGESKIEHYTSISPEDEAKYRKVLDIIAKRSMGHMRNAHMLLDQYILLGDEFTKTVTSARLYYLQLLIGSIMGRKDVVSTAILKMQEFSLTNLKTDYESLVLELIKTIYGIQPPEDDYIRKLLEGLKLYLGQFINIINDPKIYKLFGSDKQFQAAMYILYQNIRSLVHKG